MISGEEIKKLAELSRIEVKEDELESLRGEIGSILDYVGQVSEVASQGSSEGAAPQVRNVMREDGSPDWPPHAPGSFSKELIAEFPKKEGDYLKVKKIL